MCIKMTDLVGVRAFILSAGCGGIATMRPVSALAALALVQKVNRA